LQSVLAKGAITRSRNARAIDLSIVANHCAVSLRPQWAEEFVDVDLHPAFDDVAIFDPVENYEIGRESFARQRNSRKFDFVHSMERASGGNDVGFGDELDGLEFLFGKGELRPRGYTPSGADQ
jgi:hypothetical protein